MKRCFDRAAFCGMALWVVLLCACRDVASEVDGDFRPDDRVVWEMVLGNAGSRAVIGADGTGRFAPGDTIVVHTHDLIDGRECNYTLHLSDGAWVPTVRWEELGSEVEFTAWHLSPAVRLHQAGQTASDYLHLLSDYPCKEGLDRSDLLCAQVRVRAGERVPLYFKHALSRVHVVLESRDGSYSDEELQQAEVQVLTPGQLLFDLASGSLLAASGNRWVAMCALEDHSRVALLSPQLVENMPEEGWLRIRIGEREKILNVPETVGEQPFEGLISGKELTFRLNLQQAGDAPDPYAGTTCWVYGVQPPSEDQWNFDHTQLAWKEGCGWFDCNKLNPSDVTAGGDGLMCWAAATSNLIHWWLAQNGDTDAVKAYTGPQAVPSDMLHSEVFQLYKTYFSNQGDYPLKAINWFFNGVFHRNLYDSDPVDPHAGFFREQLGLHSLGAEYVGTDLKRDRFNALIRQALSSHQGILFVVNLGKAWNTHAVTLWGVKFDDEGMIDTLYMVDNNDGRSDPRGTIRTMEVRYLPYSSSNPDLYPYVPNSVGDFAVRIESLCTLSLGREWIR